MTKQMDHSKKILMLTSQHSPLDGRIFHLEAKTLRDAGHSVTIVAEKIENYPQYIDGVRIITYQKSGRGIFRKWNTLKALTSHAISIKADVLHVHEVDAPLLAAVWAKRSLSKRGRKIKIVFDSHEVWPFFFAGKTKNHFVRELIKHLVIFYENFMLSRYIDGVITAHEIEENYYKFLDPWVPVRKVLGGPPVDSWDDPPVHTGPVTVIGYDGYFTFNRGMRTVLGAFEIVAAEFPDIRLLAAGDFKYPEDKDYFEAWCERTGLRDRVEFTGWIDRSDIVNYLDRMDIGIVPNNPDIHSIRCWPANKMMYYMARAVPVVSTPSPLYIDNIKKIGCGLVAASFGHESVADSLRKLIENPDESRKMGIRGYKIAKQEYNWAKARKELLSFYDELDTFDKAKIGVISQDNY
ncbi:MAG: glycosyltransferase family 4 protein [Candidatus Electryonea clarkiae]|nr:glycosyltransferase family 4 protein [Candidatus Electryonea clarkiae]MDP8287724.1 glycosyltransferase family 4 protein [Candidatus Electryonea clarkiae]